MSIPSVYVSDMLRHRELIKRHKWVTDKHSSTCLCHESRWPYTAKLTPQQIACMRDSYCGKRSGPTALEQRSNYDRIHQPEEGWDQRAKKGDRQFLRPLQISARAEDPRRAVAVGNNCVYGQHVHLFQDFLSKDNRRIHYIKEFFTKNTPLPSIPNWK